MTELLKNRKALLLAEGCKLNKEKKKLENRLAEIKKEMDLTEPGTYVNEAGDELNISETEKYSDISPRDVLDWLKKQKPSMTSKFPECVKVQLTQLKKYVPQTVIDSWRFPLDSVLRWTWK